MSLFSCFISLLADLQTVAGISCKESYLSLPSSMAKTSQYNRETFKSILSANLLDLKFTRATGLETKPLGEAVGLPDEPWQNSFGSLGGYHCSHLPCLLATSPAITEEKSCLKIITR